MPVLDVECVVGVDRQRADAPARDRRVVLERQDRPAGEVADVQRAVVGDMHVVQRGAAAVGTVLDVERAAGIDRQCGGAAAGDRSAVVKREDRPGGHGADVDGAVVLDLDAIQGRAVVAIALAHLDIELVAEVDGQRACAVAGDRGAVVEREDGAGAGVADVDGAVVGHIDAVQRRAAVAVIAAVLDVERAVGVDGQGAGAVAGDRGAVVEREDGAGIDVADVDGAVVGHIDAVQRRAAAAVIAAVLDVDHPRACDRQRAGGHRRAVFKDQRRLVRDLHVAAAADGDAVESAGRGGAVPAGDGLNEAAAARLQRAAGDGHADQVDDGAMTGRRDRAADIADAVVDFERSAVGRFQEAEIDDRGSRCRARAYGRTCRHRRCRRPD